MPNVNGVQRNSASPLPPASYGQTLRNYREQCGVGVRELARHASRDKPITHSYISQLETGKKAFSPLLLDRLLLAVTELHQRKSTAA